jgi:hypothetical protein
VLYEIDVLESSFGNGRPKDKDFPVAFISGLGKGVIEADTEKQI